ARQPLARSGRAPLDAGRPTPVRRHRARRAHGHRPAPPAGAGAAPAAAVVALAGAGARPGPGLGPRGAGRAALAAGPGGAGGPAGRVGRVVVLGVAAGLAVRGAWDGTTPLVIAAAVALLVAGLDAVEALSQDLDHPLRADSVPLARGRLDARHLPVAVAVMAGVAAISMAVFAATGPAGDRGAQVELALVGLVPAALGAVAGAAARVPTPPDSPNDVLLPPELTGAVQAVRVLRPFLFATAGLVPLLVAHQAADHGRAPVPVEAAGAVGMAVVFALFAGWVVVRERIA